ncbi:MAG: hypothetical protein QM586_04470, partial [Xenophilus sp.]
PAPGGPGVHWFAPEGHAMAPADWDGPPALAVRLEDGDAWLLLVNAGGAPASFLLPEGRWTLRLASDDPAAAPRALAAREELPAASLWVAHQERQPQEAVLR